MAVALDLITDALLDVGVASVGEPVSSDDANLGLSTLNSLLEDLSIQNLAIYTSYDSTYTFIPGKAMYTVGPGGDWTGPRPTEIDSGYVRYTGVDYPIEDIDQDRYNLIPIKTQPGLLPTVVLLQPTFPLASMTFFPVPMVGNTFIFSSNALLSSVANLVTALSLPPGYYRMLRLNLAVELAERYGRTLSPTKLRQAATSLGNIKRQNKRSPIARFDGALLGGSSSYMQIIAGY